MSHVSVAKDLYHKMPTPAILQPMEKWAETENNLYKKIISGKLSKAEKQKALKAWADANSAFRDAEFNTTKQTIPLANSQEFFSCFFSCYLVRHNNRVPLCRILYFIRNQPRLTLLVIYLPFVALLVQKK